MRTERSRAASRIKLAVALVVALGLIAAGFFVVKMMLKAGDYDNASSFSSFAGDYFKYAGDEQSVGTAQQDIVYGDVLSTAAETPQLENDVSNGLITGEINALTKGFNGEFATGSADKYKACMLTGYSSFKTPYDVQSVALITAEEAVDSESGKLEVKKSIVTPMNLSTKYGTDISAAGIFKGDYSSKLETIVEDELDSSYGKELKDGWKDVISPKNGSFEKFALMKKGIRFYFDNASVIDYDTKTYGIASCDISYSDLDGLLRNDIGKRVVDPSKKLVAFTFDDGPSEYTAALLKVFKKYNAVATFFELGQNVEAIPNGKDLLKQELEQGCEVGTHSYSHPYYGGSNTVEKMKQDIDKGIKVIKEATGQDPTLFRPPGGIVDQKLEDAVALPCIIWSVDSQDWSNRNTQQTVNNILSAKTLDGRVVLMHSLYPSTVKAVEELIPKLEKEGYQFVTVSEIIQYRYKEAVKSNKIYGYDYFYYSGENE